MVSIGLDRVHGEPLIYSEGLYSVTFNTGLSDKEKNEGFGIINFMKGGGPFFGIAGTMLVSGPRRQGKGLFANFFAWKLRHFFGKKILRDDHAPELFGPYTLFNEDTLLGEIDAMSDIAETDTRKKSKAVKRAEMSSKVSEWRTQGRGEVLLQNSVIIKDEFWKDMNKRRPSSTMNLLFGGLLKTCYHTDTLVIGIIQRVDDLDRFTCLPDVNIHAKCVWSRVTPNTTRVALHHVEWSAAQQRLVVTGQKKTPLIIHVNGAAPRECLGGYSWFDVFTSKSAPNLKSLAGGRMRTFSKEV